jgi:hypothetical protein
MTFNTKGQNAGNKLASRVVEALVSSAKTVLTVSVATDTMCKVLNFVMLG